MPAQRKFLLTALFLLIATPLTQGALFTGISTALALANLAKYADLWGSFEADIVVQNDGRAHMYLMSYNGRVSSSNEDKKYAGIKGILPGAIVSSQTSTLVFQDLSSLGTIGSRSWAFYSYDKYSALFYFQEWSTGVRIWIDLDYVPGSTSGFQKDFEPTGGYDEQWTSSVDLRSQRNEVLGKLTYQVNYDYGYTKSSWSISISMKMSASENNEMKTTRTGPVDKPESVGFGDGVSALSDILDFFSDNSWTLSDTQKININIQNFYNNDMVASYLGGNTGYGVLPRGPAVIKKGESESIFFSDTPKNTFSASNSWACYRADGQSRFGTCIQLIMPTSEILRIRIFPEWTSDESPFGEILLDRTGKSLLYAHDTQVIRLDRTAAKSNAKMTGISSAYLKFYSSTNNWVANIDVVLYDLARQIEAPTMEDGDEAQADRIEREFEEDLVTRSWFRERKASSPIEDMVSLGQLWD